MSIIERVPPTFSLAYTSVRSQSIFQVVALWMRRVDPAAAHTLEWVISVDEGDMASIAEVQKLLAVEEPAWQAMKLVINNGPKTCVVGWNLAAAETTGKIIIAVADDFNPPERWDSLLLDLEPKNWPEGDHVIHVEDGYVHTLCTLAILTRTRYERYGYLFYPRYLSLFSDTEFTEVARRDGVVIEAMHLLFEHLHPDCGKRPRDSDDLNHASTGRWQAGEQLFNFRRSQGFPLDDGPRAEKALPAASKVVVGDKYAVYMQVTGDDFCLFEVCVRMLEEGVSDIFWAEPDEYWSGEPLEPECTAELDQVAEQVRKIGVHLRRKVFSPKASRLPGDSRIVVETRVRNDSLRWIRAEGFKHILIVDGDELWKPGTLARIQPYIDQGHNVVATYMVPVIGLPGWPIGEASDVAVVYLGGNVPFKSCRSPLGQTTVVPLPQIIHFTGTRRTMEATVAKHKRSGHYDDPEYLFELWIKEVLPNVKPGWDYLWPNGIRGLHFYVKNQIWPRCRQWLPEEWAALPESVKKYLGANT